MTTSPVDDSADPGLTDGRALMRAFLPQSPFVDALGVRLETLQPGRCTLRMPWNPRNSTVGDMIHGGAIAALVDMSIMVAAWSTCEVLPDNLRGVTVSLTTQFLAPGYRTDLLAHGHVRRSGRSLTFIDVTVTNGDIDVASAHGV